MPFKAPEAVMTGAKATPLRPPPPPQLKRVTHRFSKAKAFGLKMFLKYKTTEEFDEEDGDIAGIKVQVWAEGKCDSFRMTAALDVGVVGEFFFFLLRASRYRAVVGSG